MMSVQCRLDVTPSKSVREKVFVRREMQMTNVDKTKLEGRLTGWRQFIALFDLIT